MLHCFVTVNQFTLAVLFGLLYSIFEQANHFVVLACLLWHLYNGDGDIDFIVEGVYRPRAFKTRMNFFNIGSSLLQQPAIEYHRKLIPAIAVDVAFG